MQIISNEKHFGSIQVNIFHDHRKNISENSIAEKKFFRQQIHTICVLNDLPQMFDLSKKG